MKNHVERSTESVKHLAGRRVRPVAPGLVKLEVIAPVEEDARGRRMLRRFQRFGAGAHNSKAGGQRQRLLGAREGHVHVPVVHSEVYGPDGGHAVHQQQCRVPCLICSAPEIRHSALNRFKPIQTPNLSSLHKSYVNCRHLSSPQHKNCKTTGLQCLAQVLHSPYSSNLHKFYVHVQAQSNPALTMSTTFLHKNRKTITF